MNHCSLHLQVRDLVWQFRSKAKWQITTIHFGGWWGSVQTVDRSWGNNVLLLDSWLLVPVFGYFAFHLMQAAWFRIHSNRKLNELLVLLRLSWISILGNHLQTKNNGYRGLSMMSPTFAGRFWSCHILMSGHQSGNALSEFRILEEEALRRSKSAGSKIVKLKASVWFKHWNHTKDPDKYGYLMDSIYWTWMGLWLGLQSTWYVPKRSTTFPKRSGLNLLKRKITWIALQ